MLVPGPKPSVIPTVPGSVPQGTGRHWQPVDISAPGGGVLQPLAHSAGYGCLQLQLKRELSVLGS